MTNHRAIDQSAWLALLRDDAFAASFQSLGQYRSALINHAASPLSQPEPEVVGPELDCDSINVPAYYRGDEFNAYKHGYAEGWSAGVITADAPQPSPVPVPVPVAERPWEKEGWCNAEGKCWFLREVCGDLAWELEDPSSTITFGRISCLPYDALPVPGAEVVATELRQEGQP
jgi:hypothetical protein